VAWAEKQGIGESDPVALAARPEVRQLVEREVALRNQQLASFEQVKKFDILPRDLTIDDGELTPSLKIKRKVVAQKYGHLVERLYAEAADATREVV
jgi:long-chain acyl-CoA synthetase